MEIINEYWPYLAALIPTAGVAFLFYWVVRYMIEADRSERKALAKWNAEHRDSPDLKGAMGAPAGGPTRGGASGGDAGEKADDSGESADEGTAHESSSGSDPTST